MRLEDLTEEWDEELVPLTEREPETPLQCDWAENGFVIVQDVIDDDALCAYEEEWLTHNGGPDAVSGDVSTYASRGGWPFATPYMEHPALRRVVCDPNLAQILEELTGEPMGVHLNLTGWVSTRRNWHRDQYLNESYVGGFYAAVWIALDTIHPDSGPFEFAPATHTGKPISQQKTRDALGGYGYGDDWPTQSERVLTPLFEEELRTKRLPREYFLGHRGDILIWHGRLLHRGSIPRDGTMERRALIAHYSGIHHRPDMPPAMKEGGGWFFPLGAHTPTGYGLGA